jgi:hypothetical protein
LVQEQAAMPRPASKEGRKPNEPMTDAEEEPNEADRANVFTIINISTLLYCSHFYAVVFLLIGHIPLSTSIPLYVDVCTSNPFIVSCIYLHSIYVVCMYVCSLCN